MRNKQSGKGGDGNTSVGRIFDIIVAIVVHIGREQEEILCRHVASFMSFVGLADDKLIVVGSYSRSRL